jgi:hypothetical protein
MLSKVIFSSGFFVLNNHHYLRICLFVQARCLPHNRIWDFFAFRFFPCWVPFISIKNLFQAFLPIPSTYSNKLFCIFDFFYKYSSVHFRSIYTDIQKEKYKKTENVFISLRKIFHFFFLVVVVVVVGWPFQLCSNLFYSIHISNGYIMLF